MKAKENVRNQAKDGNITSKFVVREKRFKKI
jgi:hypothetical protein